MGWVNNREAGDLKRYRAHYDGTVMKPKASDLGVCAKYVKAGPTVR